MKQAMVAAKSDLGDEYHVAGRDGVHPEPNGHLVMAYAFLKSFGLDGNIGSVTIDVAANTADATDGHQVLSGKNGVFKLESKRYPFCFSGSEKDPDGTASILPYTSFNQDLNRFVLKVNGLQATHADVTFGSATKTFSKAQLTQGINLAAEFIDNPFVEPFDRVLDAVAEKQAAETSMIKGFTDSLICSMAKIWLAGRNATGRLPIVSKGIRSLARRPKVHVRIRFLIIFCI